jgi:hypothetical protein
MHTNMELLSQDVEERTTMLEPGADTPAEATLEAEFVPAIRRRPPVAARPAVERAEETARRPGPRVSMALEDWLETDRKMWELYNLCEIAISQRDDARDHIVKTDGQRDLLASRLREWKTYARSLEKRLHAAQIENIELSVALKRTHQVAAEAVALPAFSRKQRQNLRDRLENISDDLEG